MANVEDWQSYVERLELYFIAKNVMDENKKVAIFFSFCGVGIYRLFNGLTAPWKPKTKRFNELVSLY